MQKFILLLLLSLTLSAQTLNIYFDTPDLYLLKNDKTLKYQAKRYLTKKTKKPKYLESITYHSKTQKPTTFDVKHYNKVKTIEEKHPLLSLIKRDQRASFIALLKKEGLKYPLKLKYIFEASIDSNNSSDYKTIFLQKTKQDPLFAYKLQYPYLVNLLYSLLIAAIGLALIFVLFKRRL